VTGFGTGGTLKGVSRVLKEKRPDTQIIVCEPDNSQILGSGIPQERTADGTPADSHPLFRPHLMQGWSPDFIPKLTEDAVTMKTIDKVIPVSGDDALRLSKALASEEGIFVGISAGATLAGALQVCDGAEEGTTVLCMLPDTGERYLTTPLFDDIPADMTADEVEISRSTPGARFDAPPPAEPDEAATEEEEPEIEAPADAVKFLNDTVSDADQPVVLFALEWCEFCWSLRKMFAKYEIPYQSVDLDSVAYQEDNKGGKIRAALRERTGSKTIPQVFVGGQFIGGATELFESQKGGELAELLEKNSVVYNKDIDVDPYTFLPGWLQQR
jgi:cysteine synthase A